MLPEVLDLNARLADTASLVKRLIGPTVELETDFAADLRRVRADPGQVDQVLLNLAVNARDAMPAGGKLSLRTADVEFGKPGSGPDGIKPGRYAMLAVTDTGTGMDAATLARIFEPFFTTKGPGKGTGLGLSTVYGAVKQSGGHVEAESAPGVGTTVRVYLPSVAEFAPIAVAVVVPDVSGGLETLLLVEDEEGIRLLGTYLLERGGYTVLAVASGDEAIAVSSAYAGVIDLMVTDVMMPGTSGIQTAGKLMPTRPELKVLYMSGYSEDAVAQHGLLGAGAHFLQKPFSPAAFTAKVRDVLDA